MKPAVAVGLVLLLAGAVSAQERIPPDDALRYAKVFVDKAAKTPDLPIKVHPDATKPFGLHQENMGAMAIPNKTLSTESLAKVGTEVTPLAQLWVRNLTLVHKDQPVASDKLRVITVGIDEQEHNLPLFLLGVRKKDGGHLELVVYAKGKTPLAIVPLKKIEPIKQEFPIELEGKGENDRGVLTLTILGMYQAQLPMAKQEQ